MLYEDGGKEQHILPDHLDALRLHANRAVSPRSPGSPSGPSGAFHPLVSAIGVIALLFAMAFPILLLSFANGPAIGDH